MAITTLRSLAQLKKECVELNLEVKIRGKKESKQDYILALREHFLKEKYGDKIPVHLQLQLDMESPMLCEQYKVVKPEVQNAIWNSNDWYLEEKEDGNRMTFSFTEGEFAFYSRNISVTDYLPVNYSENVLLEGVDLSKIKDQFLLDSEVVCTNPNISTVMGSRGVVTETQLQATTAILALNSEQSLQLQRELGNPLLFKTFDCIWFNGEWIKDKPLIERRKYLARAMEQLISAGFRCEKPKSNMSNKKAFHELILKNGGEGTIAKNIHSKYCTRGVRSHRDWIKVKRTMSDSLALEGLADTVDGWISGFEPADEDKAWKGLVGALIISTNVIREDGTRYTHEIAKVANITLELRKQISDKDEDGNIILKPEMFGKTVEVDGQCVSAREKRLKHAILVRFRPDKSIDQCTITEEFLNKMIL